MNIGTGYFYISELSDIENFTLPKLNNYHIIVIALFSRELNVINNTLTIFYAFFTD